MLVGLQPLLLGRQHHDHLAAFELGHVLDHRDIGQLIPDALQHAHPDVLVGDLATPITQRDLALVTVLGNETTQVAHLDVVVAVVRARTELDFLDLDDLLLALGFSGLLLLLVLELAVVHQATDWGIGRGGNFNQIDVGFG